MYFLREHSGREGWLSFRSGLGLGWTTGTVSTIPVLGLFSGPQPSVYALWKGGSRLGVATQFWGSDTSNQPALYVIKFSFFMFSLYLWPRCVHPSYPCIAPRCYIRLCVIGPVNHSPFDRRQFKSWHEFYFHLRSHSILAQPCSPVKQ